MNTGAVRYWSLDEARRYLPRVRELVAVIRHAVQLRSGTVGSHNGERSPLLDAQEALAELEEADIILRDPVSGLLDFRALGGDGVEYFLCWRLGEDDREWWHLPEEGFPGRKRLPRDPS